jgi:hypothetical protein
MTSSHSRALADAPTTITSISSQSCPSDDLGAHSGAWFAPWFTHIREISADPAWQALVSEWARYEALSPPEGVRVLFSHSFFSLTLSSRMTLFSEVNHCRSS